MTSPAPLPQYYGASKYGTGPPCLGNRRRVLVCLPCLPCSPGARAESAYSPRESYNPEAENFKRDRGSYQQEMEHPVRARLRVRVAEAPSHPPLHERSESTSTAQQQKRDQNVCIPATRLACTKLSKPASACASERLLRQGCVKQRAWHLASCSAERAHGRMPHPEPSARAVPFRKSG